MLAFYADCKPLVLYKRNTNGIGYAMGRVSYYVAIYTLGFGILFWLDR